MFSSQGSERSCGASTNASECLWLNLENALLNFLISIALFKQLFFKFPAAPAQEYTDQEEVASKSGNNTELTETYRSCLAKRDLLVCKINHDQVSAEQKG